MVVLRASAIVAGGLAGGFSLAVFLGRLIKAFLYQVKPLDTDSYAFAVAALFIVGTVAALIPAWRAASFEPVKALRDE
jgi:ABC-type antimicrobial peptide transport system permease subunit